MDQLTAVGCSRSGGSYLAEINQGVIKWEMADL